MFNRKAVQGRSDLFVSAKTITAIPTRHHALRDALIQASLDAQVRSIGYVASAVIASRPIELDAVVVTRDDGRFVLDVVPCRRARNVEEERLTSIALANSALRRSY
jgi:hypothetical protein